MFAPVRVSDAPPLVGHAMCATASELIIFSEQGVHLVNIDGLISCQSAVVSGKAPISRIHHSATLVDRSHVYVFGGKSTSDGSALGDFYVFNVDSLEWKQITPKNAGPSPRWSHSVVATEDGKLILYGGTDGNTVFNDDFCYNPQTNEWQPLESKYKPAVGRYGHSATVIGKTIYYFGGYDESHEPLSGPRVYDIETNEWEAQSPLVDDINWGSPAPRGDHFAVALQDEKFLLIGGGGNNPNNPAYFNDIYLLDIERQTWQRAIVPNNIAGRFTTVAAVGNRIFLYGGRNEDGLLEMPIRIAATDRLFEAVAKYMVDNKLAEGAAASRMTKPKSKLRLKYEQERAARVRLQAYCALLENKLYNRSKAKELSLELLVRQLREKDLEIAALKKKNELLRMRFQAATLTPDEELKDLTSDLLLLWSKHEEIRKQREEFMQAMAASEAAIKKKMEQLSALFGEELSTVQRKKEAFAPQNSAILAVHKVSKRSSWDASLESHGSGYLKDTPDEKSEEYMAWLEQFNEKLERDKKSQYKVTEVSDSKPIDVTRLPIHTRAMSPRRSRAEDEEKSSQGERKNSGSTPSAGVGTTALPNSSNDLKSSKGSKKPSLSEQFLSGKGTFSKRLLQVTSKVSKHFAKSKGEHDDQDMPPIFKPPDSTPKFVHPLALEPVEKLISAMEQYLDYEGIFRVSGITSQVKAIYADLNTPNEITDDNPHNIAGALKYYFRELEQPLIPFSHYENAVSAMRKFESSKDITDLKKVIDSLPELNYNILKVLTKFLNRVAEHHEKNRMDLKNLGIVFGPTLLRPFKDSLEKMMTDTGPVTSFVSVCCERYVDLFGSGDASTKSSDSTDQSTSVSDSKDEGDVVEKKKKKKDKSN